MSLRSLPIALVLSGIALSFAACDTSIPVSPTTSAPSLLPPPPGVSAPAAHDHGATGMSTSALSAEANAGIAELRRLLAPFHNFDKAEEYGYSIPVPGPGVCLSDPVRGGMGYHYAYEFEDRVSDGEVHLLEPEFLVYSPTSDGKVRLSAVDYFVPYATWNDANPPELLGQAFAREDAFEAYVMHIWAFWPNPAGIFENFNPDVPLCPE